MAKDPRGDSLAISIALGGTDFFAFSARAAPSVFASSSFRPGDTERTACLLSGGAFPGAPDEASSAAPA